MTTTTAARLILTRQPSAVMLRASIAFEDVATRDALKARGYRWDARARVWFLPAADFAAQLARRPRRIVYESEASVRYAVPSALRAELDALAALGFDVDRDARNTLADFAEDVEG